MGAAEIKAKNPITDGKNINYDLENAETDDSHGCDNHTLVARVIKEYSVLLRAYFYNRIRSYDIDDYLQELYCRILIYKHPSEIKSIRKFVFTIAVNLLRDRSRRVNTRMAKNTISIDDIDDFEEHESALVELRNPARAIAGLQSLIRTEKVISSFPSSCKQAFLLHRVGGFKQKEIAVKMGVSVSAVEKYMMLAKKKLFEDIEEQEIEDTE